MRQSRFLLHLTAILVLLSPLGLLAQYSGGSGTPEDPWQIATVADLIALGANTVDYGKSFILIADIDLTGRSDFRIPIAPDTDSATSGFQGDLFTGIFDGNNHIISNLTIAGLNNDYLGLFGNIGTGGQMMNLGVANASITGRSSVGILCGSNSGFISKCYTTGSVVGDSDVGGLIGYNNGAISHCYSTCAVTANNSVGGLCGENDGPISQSYSTGKVTGNPYIGGLCGDNFDGTITMCYWDIENSGFTYSDGGFGFTTAQMKQAATYQGWNDSTWTIAEGIDYPQLNWENQPGVFINTDLDPPTYSGSGTQDDPFQISTVADLDCMSWRYPDWGSIFVLTRDLDLKDFHWDHGIIAYSAAFSGVFDGADHQISNLSIKGNNNLAGLFYKIDSDGIVKNLGLVNVNISGYGFLGSLCGKNSGSVSRCYSSGTLSGRSFIGGLCGLNSYGSFNQCYASGMLSGYRQIGGLCGRNYSGTITNSYAICEIQGNGDIGCLCGSNAGTITQCYASGSATSSDSAVGGLCGFNGNGTIRQCYSNGAVKGKSAYAGGFCGRIEGLYGTFYDNFWDTQTSGMTTSTGGAGVTGKTTAQMQDSTTYLAAGWDFVGESANGQEDIWRLPGGQGEYPLLAWQKNIPGDVAGDYGVDMADFAALGNGWLEQYDLDNLNLLVKYWLAKYYRPEPQELIPYWPFDVDARDYLSSNHGTLTNGAAITNTTGQYKIGTGALNLDGVDDLVNCGTGADMINLPVMTVSMWIKATAVPATKTMQLMGQRDLSSHIWSLQIWGANSGHITGFVGGSTANALTETTITPVVGRWYHLTMTYNDGGDRKVHLYIDGTEATTAQQTALSGTRLSNTTIPLTIGDRIGGGRAFGGNIDDVRLYRRILTPAEITQLANP